MFSRFLVYGFMGWAMEVVFTGASSALLEKDRSATAKTYLWMHPIYGGAMLLMEWMSRKLAHVHPAVRPLAYLPVIYGAEYVSGWGLRRILGKCPWHYSRGLHLHGLIRLDYAPAWLLAGYLFEPFSRRVQHALRPMTPEAGQLSPSKEVLAAPVAVASTG